MEGSLTAAGIKRSATDDIHNITRPSKRSRPTETVIKHHHTSNRQLGAELIQQGPQDPALFEQDLTRAICVALFAAGFTSARPDALQSLLSATEECQLTIYLASIVFVYSVSD